MSLEQSLRMYAGQPITIQLLLELLKDYKRPFDKISEMVKQGLLKQIKRGIFVGGAHLGLAQPEPFLLANHLKGPSYVSLESALAHWGLIPERVYEVASMTTGRSVIFDTTIGRFSYTHLSLPYYAFGQQMVELAPGQTALIASPEKALCDKIIATSGLQLRSNVQARAWLEEEMRMDSAQLRLLNSENILLWLKKAPKQNSLDILFKTLQLL